MSDSSKTLWRAACRILAAVLVVPAGAFAADIIMVTGSGVNYNQPFSFTPIPSSPNSYFLFNQDDTADKLTVSATVFLDPVDNTVSYSFTGGNYSNQDLTFSLSFDMDLTPGLTYYAAQSAITGNGTAAVGSFTTNPVAGNVLMASASTQINGTLIDLGVDNGTSCSGSASFVCTYPQANSSFLPISYAELNGTLTFDLPGSNQADSSEANYMGWNGSISLETPEPASLTLIGVGCAALAFARRRKRSRISS